MVCEQRKPCARGGTQGLTGESEVHGENLRHAGGIRGVAGERVSRGRNKSRRRVAWESYEDLPNIIKDEFTSSQGLKERNAPTTRALGRRTLAG